MTPLTTEQRRRLLNNPPPKRADEFPHLAALSPEHLISRRWEITQWLKALDAERKEIDEMLQSIYSESELRLGLAAAAGWSLKQKTRRSWVYDATVKEAIQAIQQQAQRDGQAQELITSFLSFAQIG